MDNYINWGIRNCLELADFALSISHNRRVITDVCMVVHFPVFLSKGVPSIHHHPHIFLFLLFPFYLCLTLMISFVC